MRPQSGRRALFARLCTLLVGWLAGASSTPRHQRAQPGTTWNTEVRFADYGGREYLFIMLNEHDGDIQLRCRRLGHELNFGYCRQEAGGRPCRLILDCWWEQFDVRSFLQAHLPAEDMAQIERASVAPPPAKLLSLVEMIQQAKDRGKNNP